jgi:hypothetical protein
MILLLICRLMCATIPREHIRCMHSILSFNWGVTKGMENKAKFQTNHLIFTEHHHGPSPREHKRQSDKDGPKWSSPGCGCTPTSPVWHETWSVDAYRLAQRQYGGVTQVQCTWRSVWYLPHGDEAFSKCPLLSTYKRRPLLI